MEVDRITAGLDERQFEAVTTDAAPLAIIAAAGSGKTRVLTRRIAYRIATDAAHPRHVLALTFTRDAANELRHRLRRLDIREPIETGTFHAVALRLLRDRAASTGVAAPNVAPDRIRLAREVITEARLGCDAGAALADLDWTRARLVAPGDAAAEFRRARRRAALGPDAFVRFAERYATMKRRRGVVDFDDLLEQVLAAMRRDRTWAEAVRWRFRQVLVDEAQDLNPLQWAVLDEVRGGRPDICLVGDPRQAVYGWNGADPAFLDEVERYLPGVTIVRLRGNYRCTPQVVQVGTAALAGSTSDDTVSTRPDGPTPVIRRVPDEHTEARAVLEAVRSLAERYGPRQVAVLARTNDQLAPFERLLTDAGFSVARAGGATPLDRCVAEVLRHRSREALARWVEQVWAADTTDQLRARVAEEVDRYLSSGDPGSFQAWLDARQPFDALDPADEGGAVSLLSFHAAKGREWSAVVVAGVEVGLVPHASSTSPAQRAEEARLLHVAVTRAADQLVLTCADTRAGTPTGPSPWLAAIETAAQAAPSAPPPLELQRRRPVDPLASLRRWRAGAARRAGLTEAALCSDAELRRLLANPPTDLDQVAARLGVGRAAAERLGPGLLEALAEVSPSAH